MKNKVGQHIAILIIFMIPGLAVSDTFICCYQQAYQQPPDHPYLLYSGATGTMPNYYYNTPETNNINNLDLLQFKPITYQKPRLNLAKIETLNEQLTLACMQGNKNSLTLRLVSDRRIDFTYQQEKCQGTSLYDRSRALILMQQH